MRLLNDRKDIIENLKAMDFDIMMVTYFPVEALIAKALELPYLWFLAHLVEPGIGVSLNTPHQA